jgi:hypothetical protein
MLNSKVLAIASERISKLDNRSLAEAHERAHGDTLVKSTDGLSAHHLLAAELTKRGYDCPDTLPPLLVSVTDVTKRAFEASKESLPMDLVASLRQAFESDATMASVITSLSTKGYDMEVVPRMEGDERTPEQMFADMVYPGTSEDMEPEDEMETEDEGEMPEDDDEEEMQGGALGRMLGALAELLGVEKGYSFEVENSIINRNKRKSSAKMEHEFKASKYKTRDGRVRCMTCGGEKPVEGSMCNTNKSNSKFVFKTIQQEGEKFVVYSQDGSKKLGTYDTEAEAKARLAQIEQFKKEDTFTPPQGVQDEARRALDWLKEGKAGSGFTDVGRARAVQLANGSAVSMDTIRRMHSFLSRHSVDSQGQGYKQGEKGYPSAGRVAYSAWGGEPALSWVKGIIARADKSLSFAKADERRFTLGPMYVPNMEDAHGEWTDDNELQQALWEYVRSGDRRIRLQHNKEVVAGEWVEVMTFPFPLTVPMYQADGSEEQVTYPANTVFMGIVWEPWAWKLVKEGKLRGLSIGGKAQRIDADIPEAEEMSKAEGDSCPRATQDVAINLKNREKAIKTAGYGPLNPAQPNTAFWIEKANRWDVTTAEAKKSRCGNCAMFIQTTKMLNCIEEGLATGDANTGNSWDSIKAGDLGYCEAFDFKCASSRTCNAWVTGGPVTDETANKSEPSVNTVHIDTPIGAYPKKKKPKEIAY